MKSLLMLIPFVACAESPRLGSDTQAIGVRSRYLVVFKSDTVPSDAAARIANAGGTLSRSLADVGIGIVLGDDGFATELAHDPAVLAVGADSFVRVPPTRAFPVNGAAAVEGDFYSWLQWDMERVGAPASWLRNTPAATVAVLDVGVADDHPDLQGQVVYSVSTSQCEHGASGYPSYDTILDLDLGGVCLPAPRSYELHGTHVAGTIAAKRDGVGIVGVAPNAKIAAYKVFDRYRYQGVEGLGFWLSPMFEAIVDATGRGYKVVNISAGGTFDRSTRDGNAIWHAWDRVAKWANRQGTVFAASAGNTASSNNGSITNLPSDLPTMIAVSATGTSLLVDDGTGFVPAPDAHDVLAFYSSYGSPVDIAAPGGDCGPNLDPTDDSTCEPQYLIASSCIFPDGSLDWCWDEGTSMAAPHVAGAAALVRGLHPDWSPTHVRAQLEQTADHVGTRQQFGAGVLNVDAATR